MTNNPLMVILLWNWNVVNHCLPLVSFAFLANLMKDRLFANKWTYFSVFNYFITSNNSFNLSAILCFNYVFLTLLINKIKGPFDDPRISLIFTSIIFGFISDYLLSSDSFFCLTFCVLISNYCYIEIIPKLWTKFRSSFSVGEFIIVSQLSMAYLSPSSACIVTKMINSSKSDLFCSPNKPNLVLQVIFVGIALIVMSQTFVDNRRRNFGQMFDIVIIGSIIWLTYYILLLFLSMNPIIWLIDFMFSDYKRVNLMTDWAIVLMICLIFTTIYAIKVKSKANTITRKVFHIFISIVYIIGLKSDITFLSFSSASILAIFVMIEIIRIKRLIPFSDTIESVFELFRDEKDRGVLTLTHIYLLVGFSLPIWLSPSFESRNLLAMASGLITVGFGDTAASFGGYLFGKHYWNQSKKTYEGTICALIMQIISCFLFIKYMSPEISFNFYSIFVLIFVSIISALIEANIKEIDNLVSPIYHYFLIKILL